MIPRLKQRYREEIWAGLEDSLSLDNSMKIPALDKIVVNMGVGDAINDKNLIEAAVTDLSIITGQRPRVNRAPR